MPKVKQVALLLNLIRIYDRQIIRSVDNDELSCELAAEIDEADRTARSLTRV